MKLQNRRIALLFSHKKEWEKRQICLGCSKDVPRVNCDLKQYTLTQISLQIVNPKGEMKGSAITGPVGKEAAELWPVHTPQFTALRLC